jgi:peptidoglycan/xylan/chitin deacetylase (PgdA/CDA1 family)
MFHASVNIGLLDRYRVPYSVVADGAHNGVHSIGRSDGTGPRVFFMRTERNAHGTAYSFEGATLHVELPERAAVRAALETTGHKWREDAPIVDSSGVQRASLCRATDGSIFLPFELDAPLDALLEERYLPPGGGGPLLRLARGAYYRTKPLLPDSVRLALRRRFRRLQERAAFPAWPTETSLHRLEARLLGYVEEVAGEPLPWIAPWPAPYDWSLVLTHDVERSDGYAHLGAVRSVEERLHLRSAWYFVPERDYRVEESLLESLRDSGCEIGLHGLRHDGRDLSPGSFEKRLPAMREYAHRWGANGFRSPATHRNRTFVQQLGLEHDSSWSDVARYEPQKGGSCSWLPFFIGAVVELPITMPMDHTMFELLGDTTDEVWRKKAGFLRTHGGMALMLTHPDYLLAPERLRLYEAFLAQFAADPSVWHALPHEVAAWWRERSLTGLQRSNGQWRASGPGAERVSLRLGAPAVPPASDGGNDRPSASL